MENHKGTNMTQIADLSVKILKEVFMTQIKDLSVKSEIL
jgi:hypothetical protein